METTKPMPLSGKLLKFLEQENKPFMLNAIHDRMGKEISKKVLESNVDLLVARGHLIEKTSGKSKVYCINNKLNQINSEAVSLFKCFSLLAFQFSAFQQQMLELRTLNGKIAKYTKSIHETQSRVKTIESQLKKDSTDVPLPILQARHDALTESISKLKSRADEMKQHDGPTVRFT